MPLKRIILVLTFLVGLTGVGRASDYEAKSFTEFAKTLNEESDSLIALVRIKNKTTGFIDFELIEVLAGKEIKEKEFRAYTLPDSALRAKYSEEGTEWILSFSKFPVTIENKTQLRWGYSARNALRYMQGLVYGQITQVGWRQQEEMTMAELRSLLSKK